MNLAKLINGFWVVGTNKWSVESFDQQDAEEFSQTMIDCTNCINCRFCIGCDNCHDCENLIDCYNCSNDCEGCKCCLDCEGCYDCSGCANCTNCIDCSQCNNCIDCKNCYNCNDFKTNPQRIIAPIGKNFLTTYYWNEDKEEIVDEPLFIDFEGGLQEFENALKEILQENENREDFKDAQAYLDWIERVKVYKGGNK